MHDIRLSLDSSAWIEIFNFILDSLCLMSSRMNVVFCLYHGCKARAKSCSKIVNELRLCRKKKERRKDSRCHRCGNDTVARILMRNKCDHFACLIFPYPCRQSKYSIGVYELFVLLFFRTTNSDDKIRLTTHNHCFVLETLNVSTLIPWKRNRALISLLPRLFHSWMFKREQHHHRTTTTTTTTTSTKKKRVEKKNKSHEMHIEKSEENTWTWNTDIRYYIYTELFHFCRFAVAFTQATWSRGNSSSSRREILNSQEYRSRRRSKYEKRKDKNQKGKSSKEKKVMRYGFSHCMKLFY